MITRKVLKRIREEQPHLASQYEKTVERFENRRGVIWEKIARGEKKDEIHIEVAHEVLSFIKCITLRDTDEILWYDDNKGIWKFGGKSRIKQICHQFNDRFTTHDVNEIIEKIRRMTYREREIFENHNLIAFKNCVLNLKDFSFSEHKPDNYLLSRLEVEYKPGAFPVKFEKFFNRILPDKNRNLMLEVMAYPFINDYRYNKAFLLLGSGANGKTTLLGVEKELLGGKNVTAFTIQSFEKNQFAASQLFGKMANICPDMSSQAMRTTQAFKILTGNDWATFNVKGKKAISFRNRAKMIFCANDLPIIYEDTLAVWRRLCVILFTETIPEEE